jgi:hypothetical protein
VEVIVLILLHPCANLGDASLHGQGVSDPTKGDCFGPMGFRQSCKLAGANWSSIPV